MEYILIIAFLGINQPNSIKYPDEMSCINAAVKALAIRGFGRGYEASCMRIK